MSKCGKCGCGDIHGGSWTPDYCRRCGAIDAPGGWYIDSTISHRFNPAEYDKERSKNMDDTILTEALLEQNKKMFDKAKTDFVAYEKDTICLVSRTRYTVRFTYNMTAGEVKEIMNKIPDHAGISMISDGDSEDTAEVYFDIETDGS